MESSDLRDLPCFSVAPRLSVDTGLHGGELHGVQRSQRPCSQFMLQEECEVSIQHKNFATATLQTTVLAVKTLVAID